MSNTKYDKTIAKLTALLHAEHGGCDNTTCNISVALNNGFTVNAIECFAGTGAASDEFIALYTKLDTTELSADSTIEAREMCASISHAECTNCGSTVWEIESNDGYCSSCGGSAKGDK